MHCPLQYFYPPLCMHPQVMSEVQGFLKFLDEVYATFGLEYSMALSTRPESYLVGRYSNY